MLDAMQLVSKGSMDLQKIDIEMIRDALVGVKIEPRAIKTSISNLSDRLASLQEKSNLFTNIKISEHLVVLKHQSD